MSKSFDELCQELHLSSACESHSQLEALESWCSENISQELQYPGKPSMRYRQYMALAKDYLDNFLPLVDRNTGPENKTKFNELVEYAIEQGYTKFVNSQSSIEKSVLDKVDSYGSALHKSAGGGHLSMFRKLLSHGVDVRKKDYQGHSPLKNALYLPFFNRTLLEQKEAIVREILTKAPELITERDNTGNTLVHHMAKAGFSLLMDEVLKKKPELAFIANHNGEYPIHTAILNQQTSILKRLLQIKGAGALEDSQKRIALHYAAAYGDAVMVKLCCEAIPRDCYLRTMLEEPKEADFVNENNNQYIITDKTVWFFDAFTRTLQEPIYFDKKFLVTLKSKLNIHETRQATQGDISIIRSLTMHFRPNHFNARDIDDATPILLAASFNNLDTLKLLLTDDRCIKKRDFQGFSILHHAVRNDNEPMLRLIINSLSRHSLNTILKTGDENGYSLLYHAKKMGNEDIEDLLLNHGVTESTYKAYSY